MTSNQNITAWKQSNPFQVKSLKSEGASFYLDNNPNNPMLSSLKVHWKNPESTQTYLVTYTFFWLSLLLFYLYQEFDALIWNFSWIKVKIKRFLEINKMFYS